MINSSIIIFTYESIKRVYAALKIAIIFSVILSYIPMFENKPLPIALIPNSISIWPANATNLIRKET